MHYEPGKTSHGLPRDPFKSCVIPRPIGWISTQSTSGHDNLAPYSQFNNVNFDPAIVMFSANQKTNGTRKDSVVNAEETGHFVWNMATYALREAVNKSAEEFDLGVDEFALAGLEKAPSLRVKAPRIARSPIQFECETMTTLRIPGNGPMGNVDVVFGKVLVVHIADEAIGADGLIDVLKLRPLARIGYHDYTSIESKFEMVLAGSELMRVGLEGAAERHA